MLIRDKIYNMSTERNHDAIIELVSYLPEDLGLHPEKPADMELYVVSQGVRTAGESLIEKRKVSSAYDMGYIGEAQYRQLTRDLDTNAYVAIDSAFKQPRP